MPLNPTHKKILWTFGILAVLVTGIFFFARYWLNEELPKLIAEKNKSPYAISYKSMDLSLLSRSVTVQEVVIVPKAALTDPEEKSGIFAKIPELEISGFGIADILFRDRIKAGSLTITKPEVTLYKGQKTPPKKPRNLRDDLVKPFDQVIAVSAVFIKDGNARIIDLRNDKKALDLQEFSLAVEGIVVDSTTIARKIPFRFKNYSFTCGTFYYKPKGFYHVSAKGINTTKNAFSAEDFEYLCDADRSTYDRNLKTERDLYNIRSKKIELTGLDWKFDAKDELSVRVEKLLVSGAFANIYRNKTIADDFRKKKLYSQLLRELKFKLDLEVLQLQNATLEYEEKISARGPGKLRFSPFNLTATNLKSAKGHGNLPNVNIAINARFMDVSPLKVQWTFNARNKADAFRIYGSITKFPVERLSRFLKPYLNFEGSGTLDKVLFDFRGNDNGAGGNFAVEYEDLRFEAYKKKDPKKKSRLLTAVANLLVKNDSGERPKKAIVKAEREKHKSFYNLFWKCMQEGLKQTLVIEPVAERL